jgi:GTP-binding protein Era
MNETNPETTQSAALEEEPLPPGHKSGFVAVVGRPNVGKSTLMNAFLGQKIAIVSPRPQTTRTRQLGILSEPTHQIIFIDTPGLLQPHHKLDEYMVHVANEALEDADVVLYLVDASEEPGAGDRAIAEKLAHVEGKTILAMNKNDLLKAAEVLPRSEAYRALLPDADWILFSALAPRGDNGRDALFQMILNALPEGPRYYPTDQVTETYLRDIAADLIREQILIQMREELPHGTAVQIEQFKERENGAVYIAATIFVERENHKKMLIGAKGTQLKRIGAAARKEIQSLLEAPIFLELWVKVQEKWRQDEQSLKRFGFTTKP